MEKTTVFNCTSLCLQKNHQINGNLTAVGNNVEVPFEVKRIYYLYDIPGGQSRGGHGHRRLQQLIVAASGSFDLIIDDGQVKRTFHLSRPNMGVFMPAGLWRELDNFSSGSICMVLASEIYSEDDYIRDYDEFLNYKKL